MPVNNKDISRQLRLGAKLLDLHKENKFKIRSYENAASVIERLEKPLNSIDPQEIGKIEGIGPNLEKKLMQLLNSGTYDELDRLLEKTPQGLVRLMQIRGLGAGKLGTLWRALGVTDADALIRAGKAGEIAALKGFGRKTQEQLVEAAYFFLKNAGKVMLSQALSEAEAVKKLLGQEFTRNAFSETGELRRRCEVIGQLDFITINSNKEKVHKAFENQLEKLGEHRWGSPVLGISVNFFFAEENDYTETLFRSTGSSSHLEQLPKVDFSGISSEKDIYEKMELQYIPPEMREGVGEVEKAKQKQIVPVPVELNDLQGCLHNHSHYSDGRATLTKMAEACRERGLKYFGISDHSKSAFYANGMSEERVLQQKDEVHKLNAEMAPFRIFHGVEADILSDGSLDYDDDLLKELDFVVASIHQGFNMSEKQATERLIMAIKNPYTTILGHPTARLLLSREGYPINYKAVIDACSDYGTMLEINSNPRRLDIDWRWLDYAVQKGILISINPDAHAPDEIDYLQYGVMMARKAGLSKEHILNTRSMDEVQKIFTSLKS